MNIHVFFLFFLISLYGDRRLHVILTLHLMPNEYIYAEEHPNELWMALHTHTHTTTHKNMEEKKISKNAVMAVAATAPANERPCLRQYQYALSKVDRV